MMFVNVQPPTGWFHASTKDSLIFSTFFVAVLLILLIFTLNPFHSYIPLHFFLRSFVSLDSLQQLLNGTFIPTFGGSSIMHYTK